MLEIESKEKEREKEKLFYMFLMKEIFQKVLLERRRCREGRERKKL